MSYKFSFLCFVRFQCALHAKNIWIVPKTSTNAGNLCFVSFTHSKKDKYWHCLLVFNSLFHLSIFTIECELRNVNGCLASRKLWHRKCETKQDKTKCAIILWMKNLFLMIFVICPEVLIAWTKPPCYIRVSHSCPTPQKNFSNVFFFCGVCEFRNFFGQIEKFKYNTPRHW